MNFDKLSSDNIPDIILVKKFYGYDKTARRRARMWKLKHLHEDVISMGTDNKYVYQIIIYYLSIYFNIILCNKSHKYFKFISIFIFSEYNDFLDDIDDNPELRENINVYRDSSRTVPVDAGDFDPSMPRVTLEEMLNDLDINDDTQMAEDDQ